MGTAESYPSSLRPPRPFLQDQREPTSPLADKRRRTSQTSLVSRPESSPDGISSTTTSHISPIDIPLPPSTPRIQPYQDATEYPFATEHILHPFPSPPTQLTHMLENWQVFTPSPSSSTHQHGSGRNFSNVSLDVLPLSDLFDEAYITIENDSGLRKHRDQPTSSHKKLNARRDSPSPNSSFTTSPLSRTSAGMYFGTPNSTVSPIPFRQPSWPSSGERRANAPNSSPHFSSPLRTSISSRELLSTRLSSPSSLPSSAVPNKLDLTHIFSPACSLDCITHDAVFSAGASENCLDLTFGGPTTHIPVPTCPSTIGASSTAADYLRDRILDPEFTSRYIIRDELGAGGFGFVCSAIKTGYENVAEVDVAVKYIFKDRITMLDNNIVDGKPVEVYVLNRCDHPSIIGFYGLYEDPDFFYLVSAASKTLDLG